MKEGHTTALLIHSTLSMCGHLVLETPITQIFQMKTVIRLSLHKHGVCQLESGTGITHHCSRLNRQTFNPSCSTLLAVLQYLQVGLHWGKDWCVKTC